MARKDRETETVFDPAPSPRGPEEPLSAAPIDAADMPAPLDEASALDAVVDRWFNELIKDSPVARHTPSFNHIHGALDELKRRLNQHLTREN